MRRSSAVALLLLLPLAASASIGPTTQPSMDERSTVARLFRSRQASAACRSCRRFWASNRDT